MTVPTIKSDGGPSAYYDFPEGAVTLNDIMEYKAYTSWHGDALHLKDIGKAWWRWGTKENTSKPYDARKMIYSAARLLMRYAGKRGLHDTLTAMLNDPQFALNETEGATND